VTVQDALYEVESFAIEVLDSAHRFEYQNPLREDARRRKHPNARGDVQKDCDTQDVVGPVVERDLETRRHLANSQDLPLVQPIMEHEVDGQERNKVWYGRAVHKDAGDEGKVLPHFDLVIEVLALQRFIHFALQEASAGLGVGREVEEEGVEQLAEEIEDEDCREDHVQWLVYLIDPFTIRI